LKAELESLKEKLKEKDMHIESMDEKAKILGESYQKIKGDKEAL